MTRAVTGAATIVAGAVSGTAAIWPGAMAAGSDAPRRDRAFDATVTKGNAVAAALVGHLPAYDLALGHLTLRDRLGRGRALHIGLGGEVALCLDLVGDMHRTAADKGTTGRKGAEFCESHPYGHDDTLSKMPDRSPDMAIDLSAMSQESAEQTIKCNGVNHDNRRLRDNSSPCAVHDLVNVLLRDGIRRALLGCEV